jgi:hypothetical protein
MQRLAAGDALAASAALGNATTIIFMEERNTGISPILPRPRPKW